MRSTVKSHHASTRMFVDSKNREKVRKLQSERPLAKYRLRQLTWGDCSEPLQREFKPFDDTLAFLMILTKD